MAPGFRKANLMHEKSIFLLIAPFYRELFYVGKSIVFILMVPPCHEICIRHLCYLHLGKRNKFCNLSSCDSVSNNCN